MKIKLQTLALTAGLILCSLSAAIAQQASSVRVLNVPGSVRANTDVTLTGGLYDAWSNAPLAGRLVSIEVGERYYVSSTPFNSGNSGVVSRTWRFMNPGRYRVSFKFNGDGSFSDSRITTFIDVVR